jgi:hypothetical protein
MSVLYGAPAVPQHVTDRVTKSFQKNVPDLDPNDSADALVLAHMYEGLPDDLKPHVLWDPQDCKSAARNCLALGGNKLCNDNYWQYAAYHFFNQKTKPFVNFTWQINYKILCLHHGHDHPISQTRNVTAEDFGEQTQKDYGIFVGHSEIMAKTNKFPPYFARCTEEVGAVGQTAIRTTIYKGYSETKLLFFKYSESEGTKSFHPIFLEQKGSLVNAADVMTAKWLPLLNSPEWAWLFRGDAKAPPEKLREVMSLMRAIKKDAPATE